MAVRAGGPINRKKRSAGNPSRFRSLRSSIPKRDADDCRRRAVARRTRDVGARIEDPRVIHWVRFAGPIARDLLPLAHFPAPEPDWLRRKSGGNSEFNARSDGYWPPRLRNRARRDSRGNRAWGERRARA